MKKLNELKHEVSIQQILKQIRVLTACAQTQLSNQQWHSLRLSHAYKSYQGVTEVTDSDESPLQSKYDSPTKH